MDGTRTGSRPWGRVTEQQRLADAAYIAARTANKLANRLVRRRQRSVALIDPSDEQLRFIAVHQRSDDELDDQAFQNSSEPAGPSTSGSSSSSRAVPGPYAHERYAESVKRIAIDRNEARPILLRHFEESVPAYMQEHYMQGFQKRASLCSLIAGYTAQPFHSCKEGAWSCGNVVVVKQRLVNFFSVEQFLQLYIHQLHCRTCNLKFETPSTVLR